MWPTQLLAPESLRACAGTGAETRSRAAGAGARVAAVSAPRCPYRARCSAQAKGDWRCRSQEGHLGGRCVWEGALPVTSLGCLVDTEVKQLGWQVSMWGELGREEADGLNVDGSPARGSRTSLHLAPRAGQWLRSAGPCGAGSDFAAVSTIQLLPLLLPQVCSLPGPCRYWSLHMLEPAMGF